jgi:hypothetical protein
MCKNKLCCEPSHLELGTFDQNNFSSNIPTYLMEDEKITEELAKMIKTSKKPIDHPEYKSTTQRAKHFDVGVHIIASIDNGRSWAHISSERDEEITKKIIRRKENVQNIQIKTREVGISPEIYDELKNKIYEKSIIAEKTDTDVNQTPCRIWKGGSIHGGYGRIRYNYNCYFAHVIICEWKNGKVKKPDGLVTRHLCNNKLCIEENHLEFGSPQQNMVDALKNLSLNAKLDYEKAAYIREELKQNHTLKRNSSIIFRRGLNNFSIILSKFIT